LSAYELISGIEVDRGLRAFVEEEALPGTGIEPASFWFGFSALLRELTPENKRLLRKREDLQARIDARNQRLGGRVPDPAEEAEFLSEIGYLVDPPAPFAIGTEDVDPEIAIIAGPQLVVPVSNARYALNAANARWGSLYDALYGTDALGDRPVPGGYDAERGARVVAWGRAFLDEIAPLTGGSHAEVTRYGVEDGRLVTDRGALRRSSPDGGEPRCCFATTASMPRSSSTRTIPSAAPTKQASPTSCSRARSRRSWTARIRSPRSTRRRRSPSIATGSA
jgi:malate synthase